MTEYMGRDRSTKIKQDLQQITEMLMLNGTLTECPGLVHGKMGIAVFFFHYAQFSGNELFADYAMDVIGEMDMALKQIPDLEMEKPPAGTGLLTGYAGEGMLRLTAINQTNLSWLNFL